MKITFLRLLCLLLAAVFLTACMPQVTAPSPAPATITEVPLPARTPTSTIVWFPPTATFTPFPTRAITPTADLRPALGDIIFRDDFTNPDTWNIRQSTSGSIALGKNELTLAVSAERGYLYGLRREPSLRDFYAEITASPSLCRGADEYGLLLRFSEKGGFYRFSLSCAGEVRLDKYVNGQASSPQPALPSGAVPPGAPSESRLAVSARGSELDLFANGQHLFTVTDPSIVEGTIGVFARASANSPVTVNFSDLVVYHLSP